MPIDTTSSTSGTRAVCLVEDPSIKKALRRTLRATGVNLVHSLDDADEGSIVFVDQKGRANVPNLMQVIGENGRLVVLGETIADDEIVSMMRHSSLNHVIGGASDRDEAELLTTSVKILSGDIFGLEKYLNWGVTVHTREVSSYDEKREALRAVTEFAQDVGARRQLVARIENVADELLMNAIYDAPQVSEGGLRSQRIGSDAPEIASRPATIRMASDGRYVAMSVTDHYGALEKQVILDNVLRARVERGQPRRSGEGAGLGLYFVLQSVTRFIANIETGKKTEIICLFDLRPSAREMASCADSLHIFTA